MVLRARVVVGCRAVFEEALAGVVRVVVGVTGSLVLASRVRGARLAATRLVPPLSREGVALGPARLSVWGRRVLVFGPGMMADLDA